MHLEKAGDDNKLGTRKNFSRCLPRKIAKSKNSTENSSKLDIKEESENLQRLLGNWLAIKFDAGEDNLFEDDHINTCPICLSALGDEDVVRLEKCQVKFDYSQKIVKHKRNVLKL